MSSLPAYRPVPTAAAAALLLLAPALASSADLQEPITLSSKNGVLDVLMVARAARVPAISIPNPARGWVYDICPRPASGNACPPTKANLYGGTRLALNPGDTLKIRLVNKLPPVTDSEHAEEPGMEFLAMNPTNLHTHGLLVSPRYASQANPTYGDNVFVMTFNSANGSPPAHAGHHMASAVDINTTDYVIQIPPNHPSGLFWFHPHLHGLALNQVSAGLAGILTIGSIRDYVCRDPACAAFAQNVNVRHLTLKDTQVLADGTLLDQQDPNFCLPASGSYSTPGSLGRGSCPGQNATTVGGPDYTNGKWVFTVTGQRYPNVPVASAAGEIWRIASLSGSVTYELTLYNPAQEQNMIMQVLSLDGVSIDPSAGTSEQDVEEMTKGRMKIVPCPGVRASGRPQPICTDRLHMMPSSRAEVWVAYRDANGIPTTPPSNAQAIFRTEGFTTGPDADQWPAVDLASVHFQAGGVASVPAALSVQGQATDLFPPRAIAIDMAALNAAVPVDVNCTSLPRGHSRRIFFNAPANDPDAFGMGYEEIDSDGKPVPGTFQDVTPFDPLTPTICVQLARGNKPAVERWQLVNIAGEDHNFHIHQTRFRVLTAAEIAGTRVPTAGVVVDNLPLLHADGNCVTVDDWRKGKCRAHPAIVEIPFAIAGDYLYHCHILEHEDGGMMARIRVRPFSR
ncbi:MAG: multicopper oxidase domain-containing protein [Gammaproteobacteria bacterium]|nr:multicopper oxidase domain-containing protein [Gammaproteobacteria bacterium]